VQAASTIGFLLLLPSVLSSDIPWDRKTDAWTIAGIALGANSFVGAPLAVPIIGAQGAQMLSMCGNLCCGLCLDWADGMISLADYGRLLAFFAVILGSLLDVSDAVSQESHPNQSMGGTLSFSDMLLVGNVVLGGMGVSIQSRSNGHHTKIFGCWTYAILINLGTFVVLVLPFTLYFWMYLGVTPAHSVEDWPRMFFDGAYFVFYFGSLAILPRFIGYTATPMMVKFGCLVASSVFDARGIMGHSVPFSRTRMASLMIVLVSVCFFSAQSGVAKFQTHKDLGAAPSVLEEAKCYGAALDSAKGSV